MMLQVLVWASAKSCARHCFVGGLNQMQKNVTLYRDLRPCPPNLEAMAWVFLMQPIQTSGPTAQIRVQLRM